MSEPTKLLPKNSSSLKSMRSRGIKSLTYSFWPMAKAAFMSLLIPKWNLDMVRKLWNYQPLPKLFHNSGIFIFNLWIYIVLQAHTANCICIEFDPTGKYFAVGSADALVSLWDVNELACVRTFSYLEWPVRTISFSHDGKLIAMASVSTITLNQCFLNYNFPYLALTIWLLFFFFISF